jgi:hypothetical protein
MYRSSRELHDYFGDSCIDHRHIIPSEFSQLMICELLAPEVGVGQRDGQTFSGEQIPQEVPALSIHSSRIIAHVARTGFGDRVALSRLGRTRPRTTAPERGHCPLSHAGGASKSVFMRYLPARGWTAVHPQGGDGVAPL